MKQQKTANPPRITDIRVIRTRGPWRTKSSGDLVVLDALSFTDLAWFLTYDTEELTDIPEDIRGLRAYTVRHLPADQIGGTEFHRVRRERIFGLEGRVLWQCEDLWGQKNEWVLDQNTGIEMPPFILHTYKVLDSNSGLLVLANTLFNPDNTRTHDTYSAEAFAELQQEFLAS